MAEARIGSRSFLGRVLGRLGWRRAPRPAPAEPSASGDGLDAAEQVALEQLGAADGYATHWPVGREVARSLASRRLVVIAPDYVLLTQAGRRALTGDAGRPRLT